MVPRPGHCGAAVVRDGARKTDEVSLQRHDKDDDNDDSSNVNLGVVAGVTGVLVRGGVMGVDDEEAAVADADDASFDEAVYTGCVESELRTLTTSIDESMERSCWAAERGCLLLMVIMLVVVAAAAVACDGRFSRTLLIDWFGLRIVAHR